MPYKIFKKGKLEIDMSGADIGLKGLVAKKFIWKYRYLDPVQKNNQYADQLKNKGCHFIVCLSHLGYKYDHNKVSDMTLAKETENIDLIIGRHTHIFL